ncbi:MAG TPA: hypothetical protein VHM92_05440 [Allosphingosinicella sp.]|nr:hypothetical protein [Allosphingosinicella sp.]
MPTFYFNVRGDELDVPDFAGKQLRDADAARVEAGRLGAEIARAALLAGAPTPDAVVEVDDEEMRPVAAFPVCQCGGS